MAQILCFGDSITYGMWDSQGGWVSRLRTEIDKRILKTKFLEWHEVFNLGVSGDFTKDTLRRVRSELPRRLLIEKDCVVLVGVGINDTKYGQSSTESTPAIYKRQLNGICKLAKQYTNKIVFLGLTALDGEQFGQERWLKEKMAFSNGRVQEFDAVVLEVANTNRAHYVPLFYDFYEGGNKLLADGIHPNDRGHQLIYERVKPVVWEALNL